VKFLHVMDPIERVDITKDTSFVFIREAQDRGHENFYCGIHQLSMEDGRVQAECAPLRVKPVQGEHHQIGAYQKRAAESFDTVFMRKDPPFDVDFFFATHILSLIDARKTFVFNDPGGLREATEKVFIMGFPDLIPETIITASSADILAFRTTMGGDIVVKPLDACGGRGIFRITTDDLNTHAIIETITAEGRRQCMAQRFLPESRKGDLRLIYLDGKALGGIHRVPRPDDLRGNLHVGGRAEPAKMGDRERLICSRLAPRMQELGLYFAGLDVIGGFLTEVNVTSPTGVQEVNTLDGVRLESQVIDFVERKSKGLAAGRK